MNSTLFGRDGTVVKVRCALFGRDGTVVKVRCTLLRRDGTVVKVRCALFRRDGTVVKVRCALLGRDGTVVKVSGTHFGRDGTVFEIVSAVFGTGGAVLEMEGRGRAVKSWGSCSLFCLPGYRQSDSGFQSLFCWKTLANVSRQGAHRLGTGSFNPCFAGRPSPTILSPFYDIGHAFCFNPCFAGRPSPTNRKDLI